MTEREEVANRLRAYRDRIDEIMKMIGDKQHLTAEEKSRIRVLFTVLKSSLKEETRAGYDNDKPNAPRQYVQLFRSGVIESVTDDIRYDPPVQPRDNPNIRTAIVRWLIDCLPKYLSIYEQHGIPYPFWCSMTLLGTRGFYLRESHTDGAEYVIDRDLLSIPEIEVTETSSREASVILKPMFDMLWNAAGYTHCFHYDHQGKYVGPQ